MSLGEPLRIAVIPNQAMSTNVHAVRQREADCGIAFPEIEGPLVPPYDPPLQSILWFEHVEFASEGLRIRGFGKKRRTHGCTDENTGLIACLPQGNWRSGRGHKEEKGQ